MNVYYGVPINLGEPAAPPYSPPFSNLRVKPPDLYALRAQDAIDQKERVEPDWPGPATRSRCRSGLVTG
jgi:hypothetical protein